MVALQNSRPFSDYFQDPSHFATAWKLRSKTTTGATRPSRHPACVAMTYITLQQALRGNHFIAKNTTNGACRQTAAEHVGNRYLSAACTSRCFQSAHE